MARIMVREVETGRAGGLFDVGQRGAMGAVRLCGESCQVRPQEMEDECDK